MNEKVRTGMIFLLLFIGISLIISMGGYIYFIFRKGEILQEKYNELRAIANLKEKQICEWIGERTADANVIFKNPLFYDSHGIIQVKQDMPISLKMKEYLVTVKEAYRYMDIFLVSNTGVVTVTTDTAGLFSDSLIKKILPPPGKYHEISFTGFDWNIDSILFLTLYVPLFRDHHQEWSAVMLIDPNAFLYPVIQAWPTPSESSETLLFEKNGDHVTYINELRHTKNTAMRLKIPLSSGDVASVQAVSGRLGFLEASDYRGHKVIAYAKKIPDTPWYMVAKTDQAEIFKPLLREAIGIAVALFIVIIFTGSFIYLIFKNSLSGYFQQKAREELGIATIDDILVRKQKDQMIAKLNRLYAILSNVNQEIIRASNRIGLLQQVCRILAEQGRYAMVWIGFVDDSTREVKVAASHGDIDNYLERMHIVVGDPEYKQCPTGQAIHTLKYVVCRDIEADPMMAPWIKDANKRQFLSSAAFPIIWSKEELGVLNLYSSEPDHFDNEENNLLEQLAKDISYALEFLFIEKEHKAVKEELREKEQSFRNVFHSMNDGVAIHQLEFDSDGEPSDYMILDVNPQYEKITGLKSEQVVGRLATAIYNITPAPYLDKYSDVALTGVPITFESHFAPMQKHFRISCFSQTKNGFTTVFQDITDHVNARELLQHINEELDRRVKEQTSLLESANKDLESFAYSVSHDLKTPLRAIQGFSEILKDRYSEVLPFEANHFLQNVIRAAKNMGRLIEDLLRYASLGRTGITLSRVSLDHVFRQCLNDHQMMIDNYGAELSVPDNLPEIAGSLSLTTQIVSNLLQNALIYRINDQKPIIGISWSEEKNQIILDIRDNGIGIDPRYHTKVFDVFQRLYSDEEIPGTGIGLAIVKRAAVLQGGDVRIHYSEPGKGSIFRITFLKNQ